MNHDSKSSEQPLENSDVWQVLEQATATKPGPRFVEQAVRTARLTKQDPESWWKRFLAPAPLAGLAAATAAIALAVTMLNQSTTPIVTTEVIDYDSQQAQSIQEMAETEILLAAADGLGEFSDQELVCLLGF